MKKLIAVLTVLVMVAGVPALGYAASPWTEKTTYQDRMLGKLGFGLKNLIGGVTELVTEPIDHYKASEGNKGIAVLEGLGKGIVNTVVYVVGGALHTVTFPVTSVDVPLPDNGVKCPITKK